MFNLTPCATQAGRRSRQWIGGGLVFTVLITCATLLVADLKPRELLARQDAIGGCKAALAKTGDVVGIFDVVTLSGQGSESGMLVSGRVLFNGDDSIVGRYFRCNYDPAHGGVLQ